MTADLFAPAFAGLVGAASGFQFPLFGLRWALLFHLSLKGASRMLLLREGCDDGN